MCGRPGRDEAGGGGGGGGAALGLGAPDDEFRGGGLVGVNFSILREYRGGLERVVVVEVSLPMVEASCCVTYNSWLQIEGSHADVGAHHPASHTVRISGVSRVTDNAV